MPPRAALLAACAAIVAWSTLACDDDPTPAAPTPPAVCEDKTASNVGGPLPCVSFCTLNHTGVLLVVNRIAPLAYLVLDGAFVAALPAGATSTVEVAAGVSHTVVLKDPTTSAVLFSAAPIVAQCAATTISVPMAAPPRITTER